jgi:hypothetical protein
LAYQQFGQSVRTNWTERLKRDSEVETGRFNLDVAALLRGVTSDVVRELPVEDAELQEFEMLLSAADLSGYDQRLNTLSADVWSRVKSRLRGIATLGGESWLDIPRLVEDAVRFAFALHRMRAARSGRRVSKAIAALIDLRRSFPAEIAA